MKTNALSESSMKSDQNIESDPFEPTKSVKHSDNKFNAIDSDFDRIIRSSQKNLISQSANFENSKEYSEWFNFAPVGCLILDDKHFIRHVNMTFANMIGAAKKSFYNRRLTCCICDESVMEYIQHLQLVSKTMTDQSC